MFDKIWVDVTKGVEGDVCSDTQTLILGHHLLEGHKRVWQRKRRNVGN